VPIQLSCSVRLCALSDVRCMCAPGWLVHRVATGPVSMTVEAAALRLYRSAVQDMLDAQPSTLAQDEAVCAVFSRPSLDV
jgi:hypothetical protein